MRLAVSLFLAGLMALFAAVDAGAAEIKRLRVGEHPAFTRLVFDLSGPTDYQIFALDGPNRVVVDLKAGGWRDPKLEGKAKIVKGWRYGARGQGVLRAVFDMGRPAKVSKTFTLNAGDGKPHRLIVDLRPVAAKTFSKQVGRVIAARGKWSGGQRVVSATTSAAPARKAAPAAQAPKPLTTAKAAAQKPAAPARPPVQPQIRQASVAAPFAREPRGDAPVIVLDPGHGGVDPGAVSPNGVYEKTITLAMAKELEAMLRQTGRYRVVLTRSTDKFIPLRERVAIARSAGASLFLSIHADSINTPNLKGFSVYTLSNKASDREAEMLAQRENKADLIGGVAETQFDDAQVTSILLDLSMRQTRKESLLLAGTIVDSLRSDVRLLNKPQRSAGFAVLKAPDVPSALLELGFISNSKEERLLMDPSHRQKLGRGLMRAIDRFFNTLGEMRRT